MFNLEAKRDGLQKIEDNRESIKLSSVNVTFYPTLVEGNVELTESKKEMLTEKLSYVSFM